MSDHAALHRAVFDAISSHDFDKLRELYHADTVYMVGDGVKRQGVNVPVDAARMFTGAFPDLTITIGNQYLPDEDVSIIEYTFSGTHKGDLEGIRATGKKIAVVACSIIVARNGKIVSESDYYDTMALMSQLGVTATR
ncbi:ester cyclase [Chitinispirillales bacterium ANBcel5]|uniref:ester cyclase n=1 Tax=Cellulosispirillum alkaliphilum TaxID=3039283 RepID=UPI002A5815FE|nr:ester cyclase [Chitinispirillales bacterium ANBcel5]